MRFFNQNKKGLDYLTQMETDEVKARTDVLVKSRQEVEGLIRESEEKKNELKALQRSLEERISRIGNKIKPDQIYALAFASGFNKSWDFMIPFFQESNEKMKRAIEEKAIDQTLKNLESVIEERIQKMKLTHLQPFNKLLLKKQQFENQLQVEKDKRERLRLESFVQALDWALDGNNLQKD